MRFSAPRVPARLARLAAWLAIPVTLVASAGVVGHASYAAFAATTVNPTSNWTAGSVALSDDDVNSALFTATGLKPTSTASNCIAVTSAGSLPAAVKLYATNAATTNALAANMTLTIEQGTGGGFGTCAGFTPQPSNGTLYSGTLQSFGSTATGFANGVGTWAPTGTAAETRVFRITYLVSAAAPNTVQGGTAALGFTWEAQNS